MRRVRRVEAAFSSQRMQRTLFHIPPDKILCWLPNIAQTSLCYANTLKPFFPVNCVSD